MAQLGQMNIDNISCNADSACVKYDISDINLMVKNWLSQKKVGKKSIRFRM